MDAALHRHPNGSAAAHPAEEIPSGPPSSSPKIPQSSYEITKRKNKKKKQILVSDSASSASSSNCNCSTSNSKKGIKISKSPKRIRVGYLTTTRRSSRLSDVDALGLPLGMSIAAVVAQVLERKSADTGKTSVDNLSGICILAVRESLQIVFGDRFDNFVMNFETSFRSTLKTLRLISNSSQIDDEQFLKAQSSLDTLKGTACPSEATKGNSLLHCNITEQQKTAGHQDSSFEPVTSSSHDRTEDSRCLSGDTDDHVSSNVNVKPLSQQTQRHHLPDMLKGSACPSEATKGTERQKTAGHQDSSFEAVTFSSHDRTEDSRCLSGDTDDPVASNVNMKPLSQQIVLHSEQTEQQLACAYSTTSLSNPARLSTFEKALVEQTRANDLQTVKINLTMKKLQLKERQLELSSASNLLDRWKLSMGFSKATFKEEKFKTQLQETRQVELLKTCLDLLVTGLILMLLALAYGTYVYSHQRIVEATEACSPYTESKSSWWMPKSMSTFNSGFQLLKCQIQVFSRMLFAGLMIGAVTFLLLQRSASSHQTMPLTFILFLLAGLCGYAGKFCIDTLGGSGNHWLVYWEPFCLLHFFSNTFYSILFSLLNGPIAIAENVGHKPIFPYWMRKLLFYATLLCLPLLCGLMPFAGPREWFDHFSDILRYVED